MRDGRPRGTPLRIKKDLSRSELWLVPAAGGAPRRADVAPATHSLLSNVAWHPSGTMLCATGGTEAGTARTHVRKADGE